MWAMPASRAGAAVKCFPCDAMRALRNAFELLQPAFLTGFTLPDWIRLLQENRWQVDQQYIPKAFIATAGCCVTSFIKIFDDRIDLDTLDEGAWSQPLFVLGLPRSGTTHLFHLLARDPQFAFPTRFDCQNPHTFLTLRKLRIHSLLGRLPVRTRPMDNVKTGWNSPAEDSIAICILTSSGAWLRRVFPRTCDQAFCYGHKSERVGARPQTFQAALEHFSRKLAVLHGRRLLFKSPDHTAAIPWILEVFPQARFVTVLRDPFSHFASLAGMHRSRAMTWCTLQKPAPVSDDALLGEITTALQRYVNARDTVPSGHLVEIRYQDLVSRQAQTLEEAYLGLGLAMPPHADATPQEAYRQNAHPPLPLHLKHRIRQTYAPFVAAGLFDANDLD